MPHRQQTATAALRGQFFLTYAAVGCLTPFLPVLLASARGLSDAQIGYVLAAASLAPILTPVWMTLLADAGIAARWLMAASFFVGAAILGVMIASAGFWPTLIAYALYALISVPLVSLQDGLYFAVEKRRSFFNLSHVPYHRVRVFGTVGFIVPGLILLYLVSPTGNDVWPLRLAAVLTVLGALNALFLPDPRPRTPTGGVAPKPHDTSLPTLEAVRACLNPQVLAFCGVMFLTQLTTAAYYGFYPLYLTDIVHIKAQWVGVIAGLGVGVEIFFMLGFGRLQRRLGLRGVMAGGLACIALRLLALALFPCRAVAIGSQVLHGMQVLVLHVAPAIYFNRQAQDHYRHSIQGLYAMLIVGVGKMTGSLLGGWLAGHSLRGLFVVVGVLAVLGSLLVLAVFKEPVEPAPSDPASTEAAP